MALVAERGIYGTRIEDITERADVGKGVFYNYFETKEALIATLVSQGVELLQTAYLKTLDATPSLEGRVEALIRAHVAFYNDHPEYALLFHQARGLLQLDGARASVLRRVFTDYLDRAGRLVVAGEPSAHWTADELLDIAAVLVGAVAGYRSFCIAVEQPVRVATVGRALTVGIPVALMGQAISAPDASRTQIPPAPPQ
jgi:AcrR family transcriptional regulator